MFISTKECRFTRNTKALGAVSLHYQSYHLIQLSIFYLFLSINTWFLIYLYICVIKILIRFVKIVVNEYKEALLKIMSSKKQEIAFIVEDYKLIADALGRLLNSFGCFKEIHFFYSPDYILEQVEKLKASFIMMDINLSSEINGLELTNELIKKNPDLKIMIFSMHNDPAMIKRAFKYGASAYVTKNSPTKEIRVAVQKVLNNEIYFCEEISYLKADF